MGIGENTPNAFRPNQSSVASAEGKAAQRQRNKEAGYKRTSSGSTGTAKAISTYPQLDWSDVEDEVEHVADVAGKISQSQVGASGYMTVNISVPLAYAHALLDAHMASRTAMCYIRIYGVDQSLFFSDDDEDQ